jgi:hypothetical protein
MLCHAEHRPRAAAMSLAHRMYMWGVESPLVSISCAPAGWAASQHEQHVLLFLKGPGQQQVGVLHRRHQHQ